MTTYHIILEDGKRVDLKSMSAAAAMERALQENPGKRIRECFSGNKEPQMSRDDHGIIMMPAAIIQYEVPSHVPFFAPTTTEAGAKAADNTFTFMADVPVVPRAEGKLKKRGA